MVRLGKQLSPVPPPRGDANGCEWFNVCLMENGIAAL